MLDQITPVILTYNEAANIGRTLKALHWAKRIVVVDSFSDDQTEQICLELENVEFLQRRFDQHATQWNFAIEQNITSEWILALDADHVLSDELINELKLLQPAKETNAFWASFIYLINGKPLRQSLYPPVISLYRNGQASYQQDGHTQRLAIDGKIDQLNNKIMHDDRKSSRRWLSSQWNYAQQEVVKLQQERWSDLSLADRARKSGLAPLIVVPYTFLCKGLILNGWPGVIYTGQRFIAEVCLQIARLKALFKP